MEEARATWKRIVEEMDVWAGTRKWFLTHFELKAVQAEKVVLAADTTGNAECAQKNYIIELTRAVGVQLGITAPDVRFELRDTGFSKAIAFRTKP